MPRSAQTELRSFAAARSASGAGCNSVNVVSANESSAGAIDFDALGRPRWRWITENRSAKTADDTFDYLKALENSSLSLADQSAETGYNPYDTLRAKTLRKSGMR